MEPSDQIKEPFPIEFDHNGKKYSGTATPIKSSCQDDVCYEHSIELNKENLGVIACNVNGAWSSSTITDQGLVDAIGQELLLYYE
jgi:hypothetical protein